MCNEEGQFIYTEGSGKLDRSCRCDHTEGYAFVTSPGNDPCVCYPGYDDCSCYLKLCTEGQILSPGKKISLDFLQSLELKRKLLHAAWKWK